MAFNAMVLSIYSVLVSWTYILLVILLVAKIFMWMTGSNLLGLGGTRARKDAADGTGKIGTGEGGAGGGPQQVQGFHGEMRN